MTRKHQRGTVKDGMGDKLVREQSHLGGAWSDKADKHGDTRGEQTNTASKGNTREMAQLWMVLPVLQPYTTWQSLWVPVDWNAEPAILPGRVASHSPHTPT